MRAGALNKRVTFQREVRVDDGSGGSSREFVDDFTVWGGVAPERGSERLEAGRLEASQSGILRVRSSSTTRSVDESWRVLIDNVPHQIRGAANPDQRNRMIELIVERGVAT